MEKYPFLFALLTFSAISCTHSDAAMTEAGKQAGGIHKGKWKPYSTGAENMFGNVVIGSETLKFDKLPSAWLTPDDGFYRLKWSDETKEVIDICGGQSPKTATIFVKSNELRPLEITFYKSAYGPGPDPKDSLDVCMSQSWVGSDK